MKVPGSLEFHGKAGPSQTARCPWNVISGYHFRTDLEGSVTFTESPPPLPAAPGAHFKGSHLDTENLLAVQAENNTIYFHFFFWKALLKSWSVILQPPVQSHVQLTSTMKEQLKSCQSLGTSPRRQSATHSCFLLEFSNQQQDFHFPNHPNHVASWALMGFSPLPLTAPISCGLLSLKHGQQWPHHEQK